jgi:hypothetical protein
MRYIILTLLLVVSATGSTTAQNNRKETYLAVQVTSKYNNLRDERYFILSADPGNQFAAPLYKLKDFDKRLSEKDTTHIFFNGLKVDTAALYHNYFVSETAALNFAGDMGWKLQAVSNNISSRPGHTISDVYSDIRTTVTFYFKKELE